MDFFETVTQRKSIRKFTPDLVNDQVIEKALDAAILAPNSSNLQTWDFYWIQTPSLKKLAVEACLSQAAARSAQHLVAIVADPKLWKRSNPEMIRFTESVQAPNLVKAYYSKLIPWVYRWGFLNSFAAVKWVATTCIGIFRPIGRGPHSLRSLQEVSIKSAALAAENFVLAITAQGYATCMMEGFDEQRVRKLLKLPRTARVVMVIAVGKESERGTWGPRFRLPREQVIHRI
jgi:nitroreductase